MNTTIGYDIKKEIENLRRKAIIFSTKFAKNKAVLRRGYWGHLNYSEVFSF
jgi:hypothetical protein